MSEIADTSPVLWASCPARPSLKRQMILLDSAVAIKNKQALVFQSICGTAVGALGTTTVFNRKINSRVGVPQALFRQGTV